MLFYQQRKRHDYIDFMDFILAIVLYSRVADHRNLAIREV